MLDELAFSCGTPSKYVVTPGFEGPAPRPRILGLLSLRAVNSVNDVFGEKGPASLTVVMPARSMPSAETTVILTGSVLGSAGSFCAVTVIGGSVIAGTDWPD